MAKKKEASTAITIRKSERIEKQITPDPSPVKKKPEKIEKKTDPSPLRRSDRGKKSVEVPDLPNSKSNKDKTVNSPKPSARDVDGGKKNGRHDQNVVGRKRKSLNALRYKSLFIPQRRKIEPDEEKDSTENDQLPQVIVSSSEGTAPDVKNQRELDPCDKVPESCKAAGVMETGENNTNVQNSGNMLNSSKFVEFWAPVQLSNVQIEQYCFTLLSNAITLRSSSKTDVEALRGVLTSLRKCCNHPYLEDLALQNKIKKGPELEKIIEAGTKSSGKLQLLDRILSESKKRHLRVLIVYQPSTTLSGSVPLETILIDYVHMRFGEDSCECVYSGIHPSKKQAALSSFNKDMTRFIFFLETRACHSSIRLLSTDIILMYDSDMNPANDLKCLQKISVHSQAENIMILRLYSKSTMEEKTVQLSEQNLAVENRSKSRYQSLLRWGASEQFDKLSEFLDQDVDNISSEESLLNDVMEEFLYLITNKYKSKYTDNSIITRVGNSGKSILLNNEIKTHLSDGDQPHLFWKTLLERPSPKWKFVSVLTPRQRKRPSYFLSDVEDGGARTRRKTVNNTIGPAQPKPVTEGETGRENEGVPTATHNESPSSSGNEMSIHDLLKPTVSELFKVLKLTENVKIIVETFLEFVLKNYNVSKEHTVTLQAFMISMCWIGSSLAKFKIDRSESFKIAKNHCNFTCKEDEANSVFSKLNRAKEAFLEDPGIQDALKDYIPELKGAEPDNDKSHPSENAAVSENHDSSNEDVSRKEQEDIEIENFNREWDVKRINLENDKQTEESLIRVLYNTSIIRSEKLKMLDQNFATKLEEHEKMREIHFKELKERQLAANNKVSLHGPEHETRVEEQNIPELGPTLSANPVEAETHVNIESTGPPTSEKQMADATTSSEPIVEVPAQRCDDVADIVDSVELEVREIDSNQENVAHAVEEGNEMGAKDVAPDVESGEMGMPVGNGNKDYAEDCTICPDTSHEVENCDVTGPCVDDIIPPHVKSGETGMLAENSNKVSADNGTMFLDASHAVEDRHETRPDNVEPPVVSVETGMPVENSDKAIADNGTIFLDTSQAVVERHETRPDNVEPLVVSVETGMPADNSDEVIADNGTIFLDTSQAVVERHETRPDIVEQLVVSVETGMPADNSDKVIADNGTIFLDTSHAVEDHHETCPDNVEPLVVSTETGMPADNSNKVIADNGTIFLDTSHGVEDRHKTSPDNVEPLVVSVEMGMAVSDCEKENGEDSIKSPETSQAVEECHETGPVGVAPHPDSAEMDMPAGDLDKENAEDSAICPDTSPDVQDHNETDPNDVEPHVIHAEVATQTGNSNEENADVSIISPDASHGVEDHNDLCGSSNNSPTANVSRDNVLLVHPVASPASDHSVPIITEIQNESPQQVADIVMQDNEDEAVAISFSELNINNLQPLDVSQHNQITPEEPLSTTDPASGILLETTSEDPVLVVETPHQPLLASSDVPTPLITAEIPNQNASQPDVNMVYPRGFDNHSQVAPRITNHTDPLQAEVERLYALKDNVPKFLEETKQRLNSEREKKIAEMTGQINLNYEAKIREAEVTWHARKKEIETNLNKVAMNKVLAEAFRSKCQDLAPSGHPGMPRVTQAGLVQQLHRFAAQPSMRRLHSVASSSSAGQSSGSQQTPPQPQPSLPPRPSSPPPQLQTRRQPPLQIVHQPSALFSTTPSRPQPPNTTVRPPPPNTTVRPPSTTPIRQPAIVNQITTTTTPTSRPPLTVNTITPSNTHNRWTRGMPNGPPANTNPAIINNMPARTLSNINPIIPSTIPVTSRPSPMVTPSTTPSISRPPPAVNPITSSSSLSRPPSGTNQISSSTMQNRPLASNRPMDMSAANLRVNTETRNQASHYRPSVNGETRAPAPHMRPPVSSGIRAPPPHMRSLPSSDVRAPAPHIRPFRSAASVSPDFGTQRRASQQVTSSPSLTSLTSPKNSQSPVLPPLPTSSSQPLPPLPSEPYTMPPPPSESDTVTPPPPSSESDTGPPSLPTEPYIVPSPPPPPPPETSPPPTTSAAQTSVLQRQQPPSILSVASASASHTQSSQVPSKPASANMNNTPRWVNVPTPPTKSNINVVVVDAPTPPLTSPINLVDITGSSSPVLVCLSDDD